MNTFALLFMMVNVQAQYQKWDTCFKISIAIESKQNALLKQCSQRQISD